MPGRSHVEIARAAITGGAKVIQLRDKTAPDEHLIAVGLEIKELASASGALFIVNDRLEVALACDADGLHVGQEDRSASELRSILSGKILGVSVSNVEEAIRARADGADYVGFGPVYSTATKLDAGEALGINIISEVRAACGLPVVAIGGINAANLADVAKSSADSASVISAVVCADDMIEATRSLVRLWNEAKSDCRDIGA